MLNYMVERTSDENLEDRIQRLFDSLQTDAHGEIPHAHHLEYRNQLYASPRRDVDAMAAIIGMEVWIRGAQLVFVTQSASSMINQ